MDTEELQAREVERPAPVGPDKFHVATWVVGLVFAAGIAYATLKTVPAIADRQDILEKRVYGHDTDIAILKEQLKGIDTATRETRDLVRELSRRP